MSRKMKDSGVEWIGEIPEDWEVIRYKHICNILNGYPFDSNKFNLNKGYPLIRIRDITSGNIETYYDGEYDKRYIIRKNDLLIGMDGDFNVRWWENKNALLNQRCMKVIPMQNTDNKFLYYILPFELKVTNDLTYATTVKHLSHFSVYNAKIPLPTFKEQQQIANFVDRKVAEIDHIIDKTKLSIEEYKKYKQSLITETVTKGLNLDVKMKDSGIEWIGEIPEHWGTKKLKYVTKLNQKKLNEDTYDEYIFRYVDIGSVTLENGIEGYEEMKFKDSPSRARRVVSVGDIIISTVRTYLKAITSIVDDNNVIVSTGFAVLTPFEFHHKYLEFYSKSNPFNDIIASHSYGVSYPAINASSILEFKITIPPKNEQEQIANFLDQKCSEIDALISQKEKLITELETYKKSLIFECVTGKREVI